MKIVSKIFIGIFIFILLTVIGFFIMMGLTFGGNDMCGNNILETKYSPNEKYKLIVFQRSCGATTGFSYQVSILNKESVLKNETGNIFVVDRKFVNVEWLTDKEISIEFQKDSEFFKEEYSFEGIEISITEN